MEVQHVLRDAAHLIRFTAGTAVVCCATLPHMFNACLFAGARHSEPTAE